MTRKRLYLVIILSIIFSACAPLSGTFEVGIVTEIPETSVVPSVNPSPTPLQPTHTPEPVSGTGTVMGKICFPSEHIPPMTVYFQNQATGLVEQLLIAENQLSYTLELESGDYIAFAYPDGSIDFGGMYSEAVACGLDVECLDHTIIVFTVMPGEITEGIDICDWYAQDQMPPPPGKALQAGPYQNVAGLVYSDLPAEETWWIDSNGFPQRLYPERDAKPSPSLDHVLLDRDDGIWRVDLTSGDEVNLTADPSRLEGSSQWWPANPDVIVFNSVSAEEGWGMSFGQASIVSQDGSNYQVLDENSSFWAPAPSPDGNTIAYDTGSAAWLYHLDSGKELFNVADYGLEVPEDFKIGSPSWSPDGKQLAWWVGGLFAPSGEWNMALAVFDLETNDYQFIHRYQPLGGSGGWKPPAVWSPDGEWLAFTTQGQGRIPDIVVMRIDGSEAISLGNGSDPLWGPDSSKLAFMRHDPDGGSFLENQIMLVEQGRWEPIPVDLPPGSLQISWASK